MPGWCAKDWTKATPYDGFVSTSIVSFIVRKGNPKGIKTWDDLVKPGVKVVTPEPVHVGRRQVEPARRVSRTAGSTTWRS